MSADEIAKLNCAALKMLTASLVKHRLAKRVRGKPPIPNETELRLLHHSAMLFLLEKPGCYRTGSGGRLHDGVMVFRGAPQRQIKTLLRRFFRDLESLWADGDALDIASYAIWRLNWIHPFVDGNGRASVAFAYACLCLKLCALLPGRETMMDGIFADAAKFRAVLRAAHESARLTGTPDLGAMKAYLDHKLLQQVRSAKTAR